MIKYDSSGKWFSLVSDKEHVISERLVFLLFFFF